MQRLLERCLSLETVPYRGRIYKDGHRVLVEGSYLIFYRVEEDGEDLISIIIAVIHGARDIGAVLDL